MIIAGLFVIAFAIPALVAGGVVLAIAWDYRYWVAGAIFITTLFLVGVSPGIANLEKLKLAFQAAICVTVVFFAVGSGLSSCSTNSSSYEDDPQYNRR